ncbi:MAG: glycosyltransferase family 2 protein [Lachnospiraceae bacterium]|nr:glycosyltransferase family 2 protein [Lachnospiraceae bacterium]
MRTLVIIPAYNEAENIVNTVTTLTTTCPFVDYVIINDCSKDDTAKICKENGYNFVSLPINLGIGGGMQTGYKYAMENGYDIAIQFDGDGQHNAEYIKDIIKPIEDGEADLVIGSRFINKEGFQTSFMRRFGINVLGAVLRICGKVKVTDATSGFRAASRPVIEFFSNYYAQDYPEPEAIIATSVSGFRIKEVPVVMNERTAGVSSISSFKSVYYMVKVTLAILIYKLVGKRWR